jgi:phage/plasmid primase-like uncharacterized protein
MITTLARIEVNEIKAAAKGRMLEILEHVAGIPRDSLSEREVPCPWCNGTTRFHVIDMEAGAVFCSHCFAKDNGDFLAAIMKGRNVGFPEACRLAAEFLGLVTTPGSATQPALDPLQRLARDKHAPEESLAAYGAKIRDRGVVFPTYDESGQHCNDFTIWPAGNDKERKGLYGKDKPAGLFWPHDEYDRPTLPKPGQTWLVVEGVKDAAALHGLGLQAVGLNTCRLAAKFAKLFRDVRVILVPDRDRGGEDGSKATANELRGVAAYVGVATLPVAFRETNGADVRDVLKREGGREQLLEAINSVREREEGSSNPSEPVTFGRMTSTELFGQDFSVRYLINGALAERQHGVISGRFKSQKTHIAVAAAIAMATGHRFLNAFDVPQTRRVGIFCGEGGPAHMQLMGRAICAEMLVDPAGLDKLFWFTRVPRVNEAAHREALESAVTSDALDVVILDPTYLLLSGVSDKASNYMVMADALALLTDIGERTGVTCIVVHHNKKTSDFTVPDLADISFSGTAEWAGQWILLGHRAPFDANAKSTKLWMNIGGRVGHGGLYGVDIDEYSPDGPVWHATVTDADEARQGTADAKVAARTQEQERKLDAMVEKIKNAFRHATGKDLGKRELADRVGSDYRRKGFLEAVARMINHGELETVEVVTDNNRTTDGYRRLFPNVD